MTQSVKRLLELGLTNEEVLQHLQEAGLSAFEAQQLLAKSGGKEGALSSPVQKPRAQPSPTVTITMNSDSTPFNANTTASASASSTAFVQQTQVSKPLTASSSSVDLAALWEKGILSTVEARLKRMEQLKGELDVELDDRINKRLLALFDAQRTLALSSFNTQADAKSMEIRVLLDAKIAELKSLNVSTKEESQKLDAKRELMRSLLGEITSKLTEFDQLKRSLLAEFNANAQQLQQAGVKVLEQMRADLHELETRAAKTMELENMIAQGMQEQISASVQESMRERTAMLKEELEAKFGNLDEYREMVRGQVESSLSTLMDAKKEEFNAALKKDYPQLSELSKTLVLRMDKMERMSTELESFKSQFTEVIEKKMQALESIASSRVAEMVKSQQRIMEKDVETQLSELARIRKELNERSVELESMLKNLDVFKEQFVAVIEKYVASFNASTKAFNEKNTELDKRVKEHLDEVDQKLKQLNVLLSELENTETHAELKKNQKQTKNK